MPKRGNTAIEYPVEDLVVTAEFGEAIYPYLKPLDSVCNAPDSALWHTLIEADNYHALQLLEYLYAGKVDCIYIDPPYNTGAKDWKYNNDYVDSSDEYRHSKWLSMMQKRLKIAKNLLNPMDSVLIVTIDEKEYLHLGCLLEEMFPEANIQMITDIINPRGTNRDGSRQSRDRHCPVRGAAVAQEAPQGSTEGIKVSSNHGPDPDGLKPACPPGDRPAAPSDIHVLIPRICNLLPYIAQGAYKYD